MGMHVTVVCDTLEEYLQAVSGSTASGYLNISGDEGTKTVTFDVG